MIRLCTYLTYLQLSGVLAKWSLEIPPWSWILQTIGFLLFNIFIFPIGLGTGVLFRDSKKITDLAKFVSN